MFRVVDREKDFRPIKSGFKTAAQANNWAKKNLPKDEVRLWGEPLYIWKSFRYLVEMK